MAQDVASRAVRRRRWTASGIAVLVALLAVGAPTPGWAAPTPVPTPTPEPPLPGQGPDGEAVGGARLGSVNVQVPAGAPALPKAISARGWVLADLDSGEVLAARNAHGRYPPASTLKVLTALTLLPELTNKKQVVTCVPADVDVDGTRVGLVPKGRYTVDVLFQSMLMVSGNDAANTLARVAGGVPRTLAAMNSEARRLQAFDTHAATPSGLDGPGQLTSAYDLALISRAALARADFQRYTTQRTGRIPAQKPKYPAFEFANGNRLLYNYPGTIGGKNGFTDAARHTFVGAAKHGNRRLIVTFLYGEHRPTMVTEQVARMLDWGFSLPSSVRPVGTLVDPVDPTAAPATATASPSPSPAAASPGPAPAAGEAEAADGTGDGVPTAVLAGGIGGLVLLSWTGVAVARRRSR
jgi:serine-type D-Ala-D-Ala carboxypeptidase (penicillin-binding protein 5/6)